MKLTKRVRTLLLVIASLIVLLTACVILYLNLTVYSNYVPTQEGDLYDLPDSLPTGLEVITEDEFWNDPQTVIEDEPTVPEEEVPIYETVEISDRVYNVLVIGDDARRHQPRSHSDTLILCSFNRDTKEIKLASFMRDTLIPLSNERWGRINTPYMSGGPGRIINTLNSIFSLDIQRYVIVRFDSVFALVDQIGGIDLAITDAEAKYVNRIFPEYDQLAEGSAHMNGRQALAFARSRKIAGTSGDFERTRRQRDVIKSAFRKVSQARTPNEIAALIYFALENIETNIAVDEAATMSVELLSGASGDFDEFRIPMDGGYSFARYQGGSVLNINFRKNIEALHTFLYGSADGVRIPSFQKPEMDPAEGLAETPDPNDPNALPLPAETMDPSQQPAPAIPDEPGAIPDTPAGPSPTASGGYVATG